MLRILAILLCAFFGTRSSAQITSQSKDIVVLLPHDLPEIAQSVGQSMVLHVFGNGSSYLYIEQQQLRRLAILDVSDPAHIKAVGVTRLDISGPFDFVRPLGDSSELVCFRGDGEPAILDLHHPKQPTLSRVDGLHHVVSTVPIGTTGFLLLNSSDKRDELRASDYQILDTSSPNSPRLLATVTNVQQRITSELTGTVFLLGSDGLTVVRRPRVEEENDLSKNSPRVEP